MTGSPHPPAGPTMEDVASLSNLLAAFKRARRMKRDRAAVARFELDLEPELFRLRSTLLDGSYSPGTYRCFWIHDLVRRLISAAPFRDRVVQQGLCHLLEPVFEEEFLPMSYACRRGMGTHRALRAASAGARKHRFVLHADIREFFPSIDHVILVNMLARRLTDGRVLGLCRTIVESAPPQEPVHSYFSGDDLFTPSARKRGLPIGNLTSRALREPGPASPRPLARAREATRGLRPLCR